MAVPPIASRLTPSGVTPPATRRAGRNRWHAAGHHPASRRPLRAAPAPSGVLHHTVVHRAIPHSTRPYAVSQASLWINTVDDGSHTSRRPPDQARDAHPHPHPLWKTPITPPPFHVKPPPRGSPPHPPFHVKPLPGEKGHSTSVSRETGFRGVATRQPPGNSWQLHGPALDTLLGERPGREPGRSGQGDRGGVSRETSRPARPSGRSDRIDCGSPWTGRVASRL